VTTEASSPTERWREREPAWPAIEATIRECWAVTREPVQAQLARDGTPPVLYDYAELGLETLSVAECRQRDLYTNPIGIQRALAELAADGWIEPLTTGSTQYRVTQAARAGVTAAVRAGYEVLGAIEALPAAGLAALDVLQQQVVAACLDAPEPPRQWAIRRRFRVATRQSPPLARVFEHAMDLYAYRDDAHASAWLAHERDGMAWNAFTCIWRGQARDAGEIAAIQAFRGYTATDYAAAIEALVARGWIQPEPGNHRRFEATPAGEALRNAVEARTDASFYRPWSVLSSGQWDALVAFHIQLRTRLRTLRRAGTSLV